MKKWNKTKKQRRKWWFRLTPEQQDAQLDKWMANKVAKRKARSICVMEKADIKHNCQNCIHKLTKSCDDNLRWGCEYWFNPESKIMGLAYNTDVITPENRAEWLELIKKKNPRLKVA